MATEELRFENLQGVLREFAEAARQAYRENIVKSDALATEELYNTIEYEIQVSDVRISVDLLLAEHWKYSEYDTRPHWAPSQAMQDWVRIKGIETDPKRVPSTAYLINRKIAREGTKGTGDLHEALDRIEREYTDRIVQALKRDIEDNVAFVLYRGFGLG